MTRRSGRRPSGTVTGDRHALRGPVLRTLLLLTALLLGALPPPMGERAAAPATAAASPVRAAGAAYAPGDTVPQAPGTGTGASAPARSDASPDTSPNPAAHPAPPRSEAPYAVLVTGGLRIAPAVRHPAPLLRSGPGAGPEQTYHPLAGTPPAAVLPLPPYTGPRPPRIRAAATGAPGFAALPPARAPPSSGS
ncbi:hypothetical protein [Streptomyces catenulae]|uniref:Uncharacterized protein n=1 Tax=Streptomyces catenulae TaxID=66875 RepID=A0ABV2YZX0_9ACTN|nr:hypothetical protein [Streptomyces catenulae]